MPAQSRSPRPAHRPAQMRPPRRELQQPEAGHGNQALAQTIAGQAQAQAQGQGDQESGPQIDQTSLEIVIDDVFKQVPAKYASRALPHVRAILTQCANSGVRNSNQVAYILATAQHETGFGKTSYSRSEALVEDRNSIAPHGGRYFGSPHAGPKAGRRQNLGRNREQAEVNYWDKTYGGVLGNRSGTSDASEYRGRGYVQLTGRRNYQDMTERLTAEGFSYTYGGVTYGGPNGQAIDLLGNPTHVNLVKDLAARILVLGSMQGSFTGRDLPRYVNQDGEQDPFGEENDFRNARRVINGTDQRDTIAQIARHYAQGLSTIWTMVFRGKNDA